MRKTLIFGHQKPDTDSITSAIVLAYLKNYLGESAEARTLGTLNNETKFVLKYFGFKEPKYLTDVRLQIKDIDYLKNCFLNENDSILKAYNYMNATKISVLPVIDDDKNFLGAVSMKYILADLINGDLGVLHTSYNNLLESLDGKEILRFDEEVSGSIIMPSFSSNTFTETVSIKDAIIIVGDRYKIIEYCIKNGASIIIVNNGVVLGDDILSLAREYKVNIISTRYNGVFSANLVVLSNYIKGKVNIGDIITINENDSLHDVLELANKTKYSNYPVLNNNGKCLGMFRISVMDNKHPKKVILVDHNEKEQSVIGLDEAEIVEIIDHHKIGNIGTSFPINFRNMPVGCTNTILYLMYNEYDIEIPSDIAGLMVSGIISDTLLLTSPTTTDIDRMALEDLSKIAGIDYEKYGMEMFKAGSSTKGRTISEIIYGDFKNFNVEGQKLGIGQISTMSTEEILDKKNEFIEALNNIAKNENYAGIALFVTDILKNGSYIFFNESSLTLFEGSFGIKEMEEGHFLEGVVSRKQQIVPKLIKYMDN